MSCNITPFSLEKSLHHGIIFVVKSLEIFFVILSKILILILILFDFNT